MHFFISYSSKDNTKAFEICDYLERNGKKCFIAPRDIQPGKEYGEELINAIDASKAVILLLTKESNKSPHVLREVERAVSKSIPIYVCALEQVELSKSMEYFLMTHQWSSVEAKNDYSKLLQWADTVMLERCEKTIQQKPVLRTKKLPWQMFVAVGVVCLCGAILLGLGIRSRNAVAPAQVGDTIVFGSYNGEPIEWRVLKVDEGQAVLVSKNILSMKAYDVAEGGEFNALGGETYWGDALEGEYELQVQVRGNNAWCESNIRTWLNSEKEVVIYEDQAPHISATTEHTNGYNQEAGFLNGFTQEELETIVETKIITKIGEWSTGECVITTDRVYLLSKDELQWFEEAGISKLAVPTEAAIEQDQSNWYDIALDAYGVKEYSWWLREPVEDVASQCYLVGNGYKEELLHKENVGLEGYGIRPAITVDLSAEYLCEYYAEK